MANNVDIVLRTIDKTKGGTSSAVDSFNKIKGGALAAAATLTAIAAGIGKAVGQFTQYADQVQQISRLTGQSAEESSRLVQVADDLFISYEALTAAMRTAARQGISTNIEGIINLAQEYQNLQPGVEQSAFLLDKFGRNGLEMAKVLEQPIAKLREMAEAIPQNLILSDEDMQQAKELKVATDNLNDAWQGFINSSVLALGPALTEAIGFMQRVVDGWGEGTAAIEEYTTAANYQAAVQAEVNRLVNENVILTGKYFTEAQLKAAEAQARLNISAQNGYTDLDKLASVLPAAEFEAFKEKTLGAAEALEELGDVADRTSDLNFIMSLQTRTEDFEAEKDRILEEMTELKDKILALQAEIDAGTAGEGAEGQLAELKGDMSGLTNELNQNEAAFKKWQKQAVFALIQAKLAADGLSNQEFDFLLKTGEEMGLLDPEVVEQAKTMLDAVSDVDASSLSDAVDSVKYLVGQDGKTITIYVHQITTEDEGDSSGTGDSRSTDGKGTTGESFVFNNYGTVIIPAGTSAYGEFLSVLRG